MLISARKVCPLCESCLLSLRFRSQKGLTGAVPWHLRRPYASAPLRRKQQNRKELSRSVARQSLKPRQESDGLSLASKHGSNPFGAMNRTDPGFGALAQRRKEGAQRIDRRRMTKKPSTIQREPSRTQHKAARKDRKPGDMKALRMQQALSQVSYVYRTQVKNRIDTVMTFSEFPLLDSVQRAIGSTVLQDLGDVKPTPVQRLVIPALLGMGDHKGRRRTDKERSQRKETNVMTSHVISNDKQQFLIAAETGSGKTLAYTLPIIDAIKRSEMHESEVDAQMQAQRDAEKSAQLSMFQLTAPPLSSEVEAHVGKPKVIILLPTAELVDQVGGVFKSFAHIVKLRVALLSAAFSAQVIRNRLFAPNGVDVVVCTPHLLSSIAESTPSVLSRVTHIVADEADSLFDRSFAPLTSGIIDRAQSTLQQLILCSATIPKSLDNYLRVRFPEMVRLATPNLHAIPRRVQLSVIDIDKDPYRGNRELACADTVWKVGQGSRYTYDGAGEDEPGDKEATTKMLLVFVNEREKASELATYLRGKGIDAVALSRDTTDERRASNNILDAFTSSAHSKFPSNTSDNDDNLEKGQQQQQQQRGLRVLSGTKVLISTDLLARGIDTTPVRNIILYDVPHTTIDFIHRLGRTGRMGRRGRGWVLVGKGDRRDVVREVREGMFRGGALI